MERFRVRSRAKTRGGIAVLLFIAVACVGLFELYRLLIPFDSINPLWTEATIGQTVLGNWRYGGQDAEGYLKFYDNSQTVLLPPNSHVFDANGRFIVLENHTPSSITYALPRNAIPFSWLVGAAVLIGLPIGFLIMRLRGRTGWTEPRRVRTVSRSGQSHSRSTRTRPVRRMRLKSPSRRVRLPKPSLVFRSRPRRFHARRGNSVRGFKGFGGK